MTIGRVFLHSGGPLGPEGRSALPVFLDGRKRVAFVTAANLHDETAYFERVQQTLGAPPPEGGGLDVVHLRWNNRPLDTLAGVEALFGELPVGGGFSGVAGGCGCGEGAQPSSGGAEFVGGCHAASW